MRLDLYLKMSRLVPRRTGAKELCDAGEVMVNGLAAKAGRDVHPGDRITLLLPTREITEVLGAQGLDLVALVPVGYPAKAAPTPPRREGRVTWVGF